MKHINKKKSFVIILFFLLAIVIGLYLDHPKREVLLHEINTSRGYHPGVWGRIFFNKLNYVIIVFFRFLDRLWITNIINVLLGQ